MTYAHDSAEKRRQLGAVELFVLAVAEVKRPSEKIGSWILYREFDGQVGCGGCGGGGC